MTKVPRSSFLLGAVNRLGWQMPTGFCERKKVRGKMRAGEWENIKIKFEFELSNVNMINCRLAKQRQRPLVLVARTREWKSKKKKQKLSDTMSRSSAVLWYATSSTAAQTTLRTNRDDLPWNECCFGLTGCGLCAFGITFASLLVGRSALQQHRRSMFPRVISPIVRSLRIIQQYGSHLSSTELQYPVRPACFCRWLVRAPPSCDVCRLPITFHPPNSNLTNYIFQTLITISYLNFYKTFCFDSIQKYCNQI